MIVQLCFSLALLATLLFHDVAELYPWMLVAISIVMFYSDANYDIGIVYSGKKYKT